MMCKRCHSPVMVLFDSWSPHVGWNWNTQYFIAFQLKPFGEQIKKNSHQYAIKTADKFSINWYMLMILWIWKRIDFGREACVSITFSVVIFANFFSINNWFWVDVAKSCPEQWKRKRIQISHCFIRCDWYTVSVLKDAH